MTIEAVHAETELDAEFGNGQERIVGLLALAMTIQRDAALRSTISAGYDHVAIALEDNGPYVVAERGKVVGAAMSGTIFDDVAVVDLRAAVEASAVTNTAFQRVYRSARAEAERAFIAMRASADGYTREPFAKLLRWAPLLAPDAYRQAAVLQSMSDVERPRLLGHARPTALHDYWMNVHLLGQLTLLATAAEPTAWLAEMANAFPWRVWTPSFALVRERISRLAVRGAWSSARFGVSTVDRYLANLDAPQLLRVFDAVIALVAIASAHDRDHDAITRELVARLDRRGGAELDIALSRSARLALEAPDEAESLVVGRVAPDLDARFEALARAVDSDTDAAEHDRSGYFRVILAMPLLAVAPPSVFLPREAPSTRWHPQRARDALERTLAHPARALN
jgi:hypothetical protein